MEDLFRRLLDEYPGAIIAGGAVRDHLLGKQVKDIDLWMSKDAFDRLRRSKMLLSGDLTAFSEYDIQDGDVRVISIVESSERWCPYPIQIMVVETEDGEAPTAEQIVARFDYGLCQVYYNGEGIEKTPNFMHDELNHRLTLVNERHTAPGRYEKLKKKFAGWKIDKPKEENDDI